MPRPIGDSSFSINSPALPANFTNGVQTEKKLSVSDKNMPLPKAPKAFKLKNYDKPLIQASFENINTWTQGYFDIELFPWQQYFFHYPTKDKMGIAGIRVGKSFLAGIGALWFGQTHPNSNYLNACISAEQAKIVYHTCVELANMPRFSHWIESIERSPYPLIRLINGSELNFRSVGYQGEALRGFEYDFISLDECAYITNKMTVTALRGRLLGVNRVLKQDRAGWFWQLSSPKGKTGWAFERWKRGDPMFKDANPNRYLSLRIRTTDNPKLSTEMIADIMAGYTEQMIRQELQGEFLDGDHLMFPYDLIINGADPDHAEVKWLDDEIERWRDAQRRRSNDEMLKKISMFQNAADISFFELEPQIGHRYLTAWDLGKKTNEKGRNASVGMTWDITDLPWKMVAYRYAPNQQYLMTMDQIEEWHHKYNSNSSRCHTCIDATGKGDIVNESLVIERGLDIDPIEFSGQSKPDILNAGKLALERDRVRYPFIKRFVDEMAMYEKYDKELPQDTVMAYCMSMYRAHEIAGLRMNSVAESNRPQISGERENLRRQREKLPPYSRYKRRRELAHN